MPEIAPPKELWTEARCRLLARCSTGKISPIVRSAPLRLRSGMNTPEMNHSGSIVAWTIGCAASGEPIRPETA